jgi:putative ATP-dependent endonuclease of OLD family
MTKEILSMKSENHEGNFRKALGLNPTEFSSWKNLFSTHRSRVLLVEGPIDKEYFEYLRSNKIGKEILNDNIEIVPYGGKDALKNSLMVKFVLSKLDKAYITFDEDCAQEVIPCLERLGMKPDINFYSIGLKTAGKQAIEGLLPQRIIAAVAAQETDLILQVSSTCKERQKARDLLKSKYLEEFKKHSDYTDSEMKEFVRIIHLINKHLL